MRGGKCLNNAIYLGCRLSKHTKTFVQKNWWPWPVCTTYTSKITGALLRSRPQYIMRSLKNIIWFKLAFGTNSYFIGYFQYFSEQIMTHNLFKRYCSWYEAFPYLHIRDAGRSFQRRVLAHYSGDLGPL